MPIEIIGRMTPDQACETLNALIAPHWKPFQHLDMLTVFVAPSDKSTASCTGTFSDPDEVVAVLQAVIETIRERKVQARESKLIVVPR